ncbi:hypothetical protein BV22DRAFT_1052610 [Leucogyrophana mollusca]|uniref:Uncharacterized protein n=1 Tax=Leucogyrophana mollusca TaxID=85980 RepID=A0ACB8AUJ7_9AGAM|nr:hypothetical protein BV22DRAFT_1052610 [Leucogyrophana mollusca]
MSVSEKDERMRVKWIASVRKIREINSTLSSRVNCYDVTSLVTPEIRTISTLTWGLRAPTTATNSLLLPSPLSPFPTPPPISPSVNSPRREVQIGQCNKGGKRASGRGLDTGQLSALSAYPSHQHVCESQTGSLPWLSHSSEPTNKTPNEPPGLPDPRKLSSHSLASTASLTPEQADFVHSLYTNYVPASIVTRVIERMVADPSARFQDSTLRSGGMIGSAPPSYEYAVRCVVLDGVTDSSLMAAKLLGLIA